jgi:hypothetical protein
MGDLAGASDLPTVGMMVCMADRTYFHAAFILFINRLKTEGTAVLHGAS